ncbi:Uncharacterized protein PCOAH_00005230 [Plasmodium coatneyi]|uniref:Uncharacterized protein n=1 Tax=Plasmodium coatneyi TaxID=208452 RepID=A0A1B1DU28_9APIC|nr:Uncharacterized protein PCOAH_00005230 [Plasmodium coatneyi]ANQ06273.1 Uncharacterized protein PCOAH_00005230 [Plasmodium coatneyi]
MTSRSKQREHGGTVRTMNHHEETSRTNRKGTGEEGVNMENIKTLYHIFSSADGNHIDGGDKKKCVKDMRDLTGGTQSTAAVVVPPRRDKKGSSKEKELLNHFNYLGHFGEYSCSHLTDAERRRNKKDDPSFQQSVEVTLDWEALQRVDDLCGDYPAEEERVGGGEFFDNSKRGMQNRVSHLKYHNGGERKDTSSSPTEGEKSEQSQRRQPYRGDAVQLRREINPRESNQTGETNKDRFVSPSNETSFYEAFKGTHFDKPFYRNSNVDKVLKPQQSNLERTEEHLGGAKMTPLNWDRKYSTLIHLPIGNPKGDLIKRNANNVEVEPAEDPFLNLIDQENSTDEVPLFEDHSYREDLTSAIFDSNAGTNDGANKMDPLGGSIQKREDLIQMDDFHTRDVSPLGSENIFGESTNWKVMNINEEAVLFSRELPIWESSPLEGEFPSSLFPMDGDHFTGGETKGGRLHIGGDGTAGGYKVDKPVQWGKPNRVDHPQMVDVRRGDNNPCVSRFKKNSSLERIKLLHDELINLSDGSSTSGKTTSTRKGTPPRGEPNVGWLSMGEEKTQSGKNPPWGEQDFFDFEQDEGVGAPQGGKADWVTDTHKRLACSEVGTAKGESHVGLLTETRHQRDGKAEVEDVLTYDEHYLTEQRMVEEAAPMDDECSSFLDIIDEIVNVSKDIIGTDQNEDGVVEVLQGSPDEGIENSHIGGHLDVPVKAVVEPGQVSTHAGVYKDPPEHNLVEDVYFHFDQLSESCRKREEGEDSIRGAVHENTNSTDVNAQQVTHPHSRNRLGEREDDTSGIQEEDPQEIPTCETTSEGVDLPTMQLLEGLYRVLMCREYLEALPVLAAHTGGKRAERNPIRGTTHCGAGNYQSGGPLCRNVSLITFHNYLRRAKKMNKRGFPEMYDYSDYVYTHIEKVLRMDIRRFFFTSNYLENINRYVIKKNRLINDLTNAQNFVNDFLQKKENVITQKRFCDDVTYPMYFLIFTDLLVTLWHTSLFHLDGANWSKMVRFLTRRLHKKTTIHVLRRSHSFLSRIYRHLTKHPLDEKEKKKIIRIVKRSKSFKTVQRNIHRINTFCFYVLIFFLPLSVPPFGKELNTRDYFMHCFLRNMNKVVLRYAKEHTTDGLGVSSGGNLHTDAPPSKNRRSENMGHVVRKVVRSSKKNICRLKMQSLAQVFRCSFEDAPWGGRPKSGSTRSHTNGLRNRHPNNLVDPLRDIHISARIEQIEKELTAYLRANAHFHDTFFNVIVPMLNDITTLLENLQAIFALYVKHKVQNSKKLFFFRNPWLCSYDVFLSFTQSGGPAPNYAEKSGMTSGLAGSLTDDSRDSLPSDFAAYIAQQDRQLAQEDLGALYDIKRVKEMLLLESRKKGTSRRNTNGDRPNHAKLNTYYSYILKLCHDERYKEINTRALKCLFCSLYFS